MSATSRPDLLPTTFDGSLDRFIEESGEVLKVIGKIKRFGPHPTDGATGIKYDNAGDLFAELDDVEHAAKEIRRLFSAELKR